MVGKVLATVATLAVAGGGIFWGLTMPSRLDSASIPAHTGDAAAGERIFNIGGCASCHAAKGAKDDERLILGGGRELVTDFGTFRAPNISPDPVSGIGGWSDEDFLNAMMRGVSPSGEHYYPSFPYTSYARMRPEDAIDLHAYLKTLPPVQATVAGHDLAFPFTIRRGLGLWKALYLDDAPVVALPDDAGGAAELGRYLAEGPGHCGECHSPRSAIGGIDPSRWLAGAPNPDGEGTIPNITPGPGGIADWSAEDIAYSLESGFKPDYDSFGGSMVEVQENLARLSAEDRAAIAAYLKLVPAHPDAVLASE